MVWWLLDVSEDRRKMFKIVHTNGNERNLQADEVKSLEVTESYSFIQVETDVGVWLAKSIEVVDDNEN